MGIPLWYEVRDNVGLKFQYNHCDVHLPQWLSGVQTPIVRTVSERFYRLGFGLTSQV